MATTPNDASNVQISAEQEQVETSLAFTVQLDDPKPDGRKLKIHDKISSFALRHRRNPSLPDFKVVKTAKSLDSAESKPSPFIKFGKHLGTPKAGYHSEGYFSSDQDEESIKQRHRSNNKTLHPISPVTEDVGFVPQLNGTKSVEPTKTKPVANLRRSSMNDIDIKKMMKPKHNTTFTVDEPVLDGDKSDTVSEAGTYTVEKEEEKESPEESAENVDEGQAEHRKTLTPENHKWINDWVKKVVEENLKEPSEAPLSASGSSSASASKIPSPVNTMPKIREPVVTRRSDRISQQKTNGVVHRRSSSLSSKDFADHRKSDSSLETESYLMATESVVVAMQSRMRQNLKLNLGPSSMDKAAGSSRKERIHPPSTASDTDTNSDNDAKTFKKPTGTPFSSARLNRAFSLRRARADGEVESTEQKKRTAAPPPVLEKRTGTKTVVAAQSSKPKVTNNNASTPFARTDVGRFSMRSTATTPKVNTPSPSQKKDVKKGGRSNSSLSPREMEFQNWKRRKSFDPMKAAAEGRKKEAAKKAGTGTGNASVSSMTSSQSSAHVSMTNSNIMTQSVNLGTTIQTRGGSSVLRSASFHVTPHGHQDEDVDLEDDDEEEEAAPASPISSCCYPPPALPPNSPNRVQDKQRALSQGRTSSRGSLNSGLSDIHSSPSHRARAELIDNLLVSAISELSIGLKIKSSDLLKRLDEYYEGDDRITRMREELAVSERGSSHSSPARKTASRDFPAILKNLKALDSVLHLINEVLFDEPAEDD